MVPLPPLLPASLAAWLEQEAGARTQQWDSTFRVGPESFEIAVSRLAPLCVWLFTHPTTREAAHLMIRAARASGAAPAVRAVLAERHKCTIAFLGFPDPFRTFWTFLIFHVLV